MNSSNANHDPSSTPYYSHGRTLADPPASMFGEGQVWWDLYWCSVDRFYMVAWWGVDAEVGKVQNMD